MRATLINNIPISISMRETSVIVGDQAADAAIDNALNPRTAPTDVMTNPGIPKQMIGFLTVII